MRVFVYNWKKVTNGVTNGVTNVVLKYHENTIIMFKNWAKCTVFCSKLPPFAPQKWSKQDT